MKAFRCIGSGLGAAGDFRRPLTMKPHQRPRGERGYPNEEIEYAH